MKPCPVCQSILIGQVIGIQWGYPNSNLIAACVHNCTCGTTRYLDWKETPDDIRAESLIAEKARLAIEGAI